MLDAVESSSGRAVLEAVNVALRDGLRYGAQDQSSAYAMEVLIQARIPFHAATRPGLADGSPSRSRPASKVAQWVGRFWSPGGTHSEQVGRLSTSYAQMELRELAWWDVVEFFAAHQPLGEVDGERRGRGKQAVRADSSVIVAMVQSLDGQDGRFANFFGLVSGQVETRSGTRSSQIYTALCLIQRVLDRDRSEACTDLAAALAAA